MRLYRVIAYLRADGSDVEICEQAGEEAMDMKDGASRVRTDCGAYFGRTADWRESRAEALGLAIASMEQAAASVQAGIEELRRRLVEAACA